MKAAYVLIFPVSSDIFDLFGMQLVHKVSGQV